MDATVDTAEESGSESLRLHSKTVLAVLFGLTFEKALAVRCDGLSSYSSFWEILKNVRSEPLPYVLGSLQLLAFLATIFRFYAGSYRLHQEPAPDTPWRKLVDLTGTVVLFIGLYVAALVVNSFGLFLGCVAAFHVFDCLWLGLAWHKSMPKYLKEVFALYWIYDLITIGVALLAWGVFHRWRIAPNWYQAVSGTVLLSMFVWDMVFQMHHWYFDPQEWKHRYGR